jgi:hypothetical protein
MEGGRLAKPQAHDDQIALDSVELRDSRQVRPSLKAEALEEFKR